jgi:hypothetical protein
MSVYTGKEKNPMLLTKSCEKAVANNSPDVLIGKEVIAEGKDRSRFTDS